MSLPGVWPQILDFFGTALVIEPSPGKLAGDAGLLAIRQLDQRVGLTRAVAGPGGFGGLNRSNALSGQE